MPYPPQFHNGEQQQREWVQQREHKHNNQLSPVEQTQQCWTLLPCQIGESPTIVIGHCSDQCNDAALRQKQSTHALQGVCFDSTAIDDWGGWKLERENS